ncbi:MAG: ATP-dependent endonuclease, partial [Flavobacteriales bacterium]
MQSEKFKSLIQENFSFSLTNDQEKLIEQLHRFFFSTSPKKLFVLNGYAGTGKTSVVSALTKI